MKESSKDLYAVFAEQNKEYLKKGNISAYAENLRKMASVLKTERKHEDELKHLLIAFYIDVSGWNGKSVIDWESVVDIVVAADKAGKMASLDRFYESIIRSDMVPLSVIEPADGYKLLCVCINDIFEFHSKCKRNGIISRN